LRVGIFVIIILLLILGFYIKFLITKDGVEILQFALFGFIWLFMSASYLLFESSELKENLKDNNKRKFNLITGYSLFTILIIIFLQFIKTTVSTF
jgi:hypothetical protein